MRFENTGLPNTEKVKKAFDFSWSRFEPAFKKGFDAKITQFENAANAQLRQLLSRPGMSEMDKKTLTAEFNTQVTNQKRGMQQDYQRNLEASFAAGPLSPAVSVASLVPNASDNLIAAALLIESVRSPADMTEMTQKFDNDLVKLVTEYRNLELYQAELEVNLPKASADAKRLFLSVIISDLSDIIRIGRTLQPGQYMEAMGGPGQLRDFVKLASLIRGNDPKMDAAFVKVFNESNKLLIEGFELKTSDDGSKYQIKALPKKATPNAPAPGAKPGGAFNNNAAQQKGPSTYGKLPANNNNQPHYTISINPNGPHYGVKPPNTFRF